MIIIFSEEELTDLLRKYFPTALISEDNIVDNVKVTGYPTRDFEISFKNKTIAKPDEGGENGNSNSKP